MAISVEERDAAGQMTHGQILKALSGLYIGLFVAILSSTIVTNALPTIVADLHTGQSTYTWVIASTLLTTTVSTPIWGKLADLAGKKMLIQLGLTVFCIGSTLSGLAPNPGTLIAARALQGVGAGGLLALSQVIMATIISPRQRGRYSGYMGAVLAVGTSGGPLIGGVIVDAHGLGWRWCFYVVVPFALLAMAVLHRNIDLPVNRRRVEVDWTGATLITAAASLLLIWVTFAGVDYDWMSWQTGAMVGGSLVLAVLFVLAEARAGEPIVPLHLFRNRTVTLAVVASLLIGVEMYVGTTFLSQYFQTARDASPTRAGILTLPLILGLALASTVVGRIITARGRWKPYLILGGVLVTAGAGLLGLVRQSTPYWEIAVSMTCLGLGLGMTLQNLVLAVQNQVRREQLGATTTVVSFFRTLGGTIGVSALGALLANRVSAYTADGLARIGVRSTQQSDGSIPKLSSLPVPVRSVVESSFGHATGNLFVGTAPFAVLALIAILCIKEVPLRTVSFAGTQSDEQTGGP
jgi:EmrB/QacA subfamily drug resistance transporter